MPVVVPVYSVACYATKCFASVEEGKEGGTKSFSKLITLPNAIPTTFEDLAVPRRPTLLLLSHIAKQLLCSGSSFEPASCQGG